MVWIYTYHLMILMAVGAAPSWFTVKRGMRRDEDVPVDGKDAWGKHQQWR